VSKDFNNPSKEIASPTLYAKQLRQLGRSDNQACPNLEPAKHGLRDKIGDVSQSESPGNDADKPCQHRYCRRQVGLAQRISSLTPQQFRVLMMLADGRLNKQIGGDLNVSEATIKAHVTAVLRKLGLYRRTQAAVLAQRLLKAEGASLAHAVSAPETQRIKPGVKTDNVRMSPRSQQSEDHA